MGRHTRQHSDDLETRWHDLCWGVKRSIRYHERRQAYYIRINAASTAISLIFGTSAFGLIVRGHDAIAMACSLLVAIASLFNLVTKASEMARRHEMLRQRWGTLQSRLETSEQTEALWKELRRERLSIENDEPPIQRIVDAMCHNDLLLANGYDPLDPDDAPYFRIIPWFYSVTGNLIPWNTANLTSRSAPVIDLPSPQ